jgi:hypothetical protein
LIWFAYHAQGKSIKQLLRSPTTGAIWKNWAQW